MSRDAEIAYVASLIGKPWAINGYGPDLYGCWGLFVVVQQALFARMLPKVEVSDQRGSKKVSAQQRMYVEIARAIADHPVRKEWVQVEEPEHGCAVLMSRIHVPAHIGVYLNYDGGSVLHADEEHGVVFEDIPRLRARQWMGITFYKYVGP